MSLGGGQRSAYGLHKFNQTPSRPIVVVTEPPRDGAGSGSQTRVESVERFDGKNDPDAERINHSIQCVKNILQGQSSSSSGSTGPDQNLTIHVHTAHLLMFMFLPTNNPTVGAGPDPLDATLSTWKSQFKANVEKEVKTGKEQMNKTGLEAALKNMGFQVSKDVLNLLMSAFQTCDPNKPDTIDDIEFNHFIHLLTYCRCCIFEEINVISSINQSDAANRLEREMQAQKNKPLPSSKRCIYKVPKLLRQTDHQAYTPILFPIGPNHCKLETGESKDLKLKYLNSFLSNGCQSIQELRKVVTEYETDIRERYVNPSTSDLDRSKFSNMVLTDSAFLIQLFTEGAKESTFDDLIWGKPYLKHQVFRDIFLMENQLPFFILRKLLEVQGKSDEDIAKLMSDFLSKNYGIYINPGLISTPNIEHLLDLVRSYYVRCLHPAAAIQPSSWIKVIPTASKLVQANIRFQVSKSSNLHGIHFNANEGILTLPKFEVGDRMECLFRNLIAYEMCHYAQTPYLTSYLFFMDCLIDSHEDIQVLAKAGVVENMLGSGKKLSKMFNSLCKNVDGNGNAYSYADQTKQINAYYNTPMNRYKAILKDTYLSTPWLKIKFAAAVYVALITTVGAVAAILSVPGMPRLFKWT